MSARVPKNFLTELCFTGAVTALFGAYSLLSPGMFGWEQLLLFPAGILAEEALLLSFRHFRWSGQLLYFGFIPLMIWAEQSNFIDIYKCYAARQCFLFTGFMLIFWGGDFLLRSGKKRKWKPVCCALLTGILYTPAVTILCRNKLDDARVSFESVKAVYQTDLAEAANYLFRQSYGGWLLAAAVIILTGLSYWNFRTAGNVSKRMLWIASASIALGLGITECSFLSPKFNSRCTDLIIRSLEYFDEIDRYAHSREARLLKARSLKQGESAKGIFVLILGESHNKHYFSSYGYKLPTTPNLNKFRQDKNFIFFENAYSNHCQTVPTLSYLLSNRNQYERDTQAVTLLDMVHVLGGRSLWLSNQYPYSEFDTPVAAIANGADKVHFLNTGSDFLIQRTDYDTSLARELPTMLDFDNGLIVLHMMGSHRHYPNRYPENYLEDQPFSEYEKSVHYSDKALGEMMTFLRQDKRVKAVVYVSDHSHIPADKRGHNADQYAQEMTEIPMFVYLSEQYRSEQPELAANLEKNRTAVFTNDLIFELMLSLWGVAPESRWNIAQHGYALDYSTARTLWGTEKLQKK